MELSFSSERADYDDAPLFTANHTNKNIKRGFDIEEDEKKDDAAPKKKHDGWNANNNTRSEPIILPVVAPKSSGFFDSGGMVSKNKIAPLTQSNSKKFTASTVVNSTAASSTEATVQSFDPNETSVSHHRRNSNSISRSASRRERQARKKMQKPMTKPQEEFFTPGGFVDAETPRAMNDAKSVTPTASNAILLKSSSTSATSSTLPPSSLLFGGSTGGTNKSMIDDLARKGGKGAFAPTKEMLDFSSDEEEEGGSNDARRKKQKKSEQKERDQKARDSDVPLRRDAHHGATSSTSSLSSSATPASSAAPTDISPLINSTALDFVLRRFLSTLLGGMQLTWSQQCSDSTMPGVPLRHKLLQFAWMVYPALLCVIFNALTYNDVITSSGASAAIAGILAATMHALIHGAHKRVLTSTEGTNVSVVVSNSADVTSAASSSSTIKPTNHDSFESDLKRLVKVEAKRNGTLPTKKQTKVTKVEVKKAEEEDDASLPPGEARRKVIAEVEDDDDDIESQRGGASSPSSSSPLLTLSTPSLWRFLISPMPRSYSAIAMRSLTCGVIIAGMCYFMTWSSIAARFDSTSSSATFNASSVIYILFSYLSFSFCFYSLNVRAPVELAKYSAIGGWIEEEIILPHGRVFYVSIMIVLDLVVRVTIEQGGFVDSTVIDIRNAAMIIFLFLPLLFCIGVLPPLDALLLWTIEQITLIFFSIRAQATMFRTFATLFIHIISACVVFIVWSASASVTGAESAAVCFAIGLSYFLAHNLLPIKLCAGGSSELGNDIIIATNKQGIFPLTRSSYLRLGVLFFTCLIGVILSITSNNLLYHIQTLHNADAAFDVAVLVLAIIFYIEGEIYRPYLLFNLLKNPLYGRLVLKDAKSKSLTHSTSAISHRALTWFTRFFLLVYLTFHQDAYNFISPHSSHTTSTATGKLTLFAYSILLLRTYNSVWTDCRDCVIHVLCVIGVNIVTSVASDSYWSSLDYNVRLLICAFVYHRVRYDLAGKMWYFVIHTHTAFTQRKLAMQHESTMKLICIMLMPYHFLLLIFSSLLQSPISPFLGSPIFLPAFPRPSRIWAEFGGRYSSNSGNASEDINTGKVNTTHKNGGSDTVFYKQMAPEVLKALESGFLSGSFSTTLKTGDYFLLRSEPYLMFCCVLEQGMDYVVVQLKGLELQTTSCHTVEALRLDETLDQVLAEKSEDHAKLPLVSPLGLRYSHTPLQKLHGIKSYSITKNSLAGIIDSTDNLKLLSQTFLRVIMVKVSAMINSKQGSGSSSLSDALPPAWLKPSVSSYDLSQLSDSGIWSDSYAVHLFASHPPSQQDQALFKKICLSCYSLVDVLSSDVISTGGKLTPSHVHSVFQGKIGSSLYSDYLLGVSEDTKQLKQLVLSSYRIACKAIYDCVSLMTLEVLSTSDTTQYETFQEYLIEYDSDWYIHVVAANPEWERLLTAGTKKMWTMTSGEGRETYASLTLEMSSISLSLCTLSTSAINSIWCSLVTELQYFANDDDERYSIQAQTQLLRNLTIQASEPPYGYPVYSTHPITLTTN